MPKFKCDILGDFQTPCLGNNTFGEVNIELSQVVTQIGHCIKISTNGTYDQKLTGTHISMRMNTFAEGGSIKIKLL